MNWDLRVSSVNDLKISGSVPHAEVTQSGIVFYAVVPEGKSASLILYEKDSPNIIREIDFPSEPVMGRIFALRLSGIPRSEVRYNYRIGGKVVTDPCAQAIVGLEHFSAAGAGGEHRLRCALIDPDFDWGEKERRPHIPYSESVFYELHVRGFTKSRTSRVTKRGTFHAITEKIPYLKELGITALVLMPCYEFDERIREADKTGWRPDNLADEPGDVSKSGMDASGAAGDMAGADHKTGSVSRTGGVSDAGGTSKTGGASDAGGVSKTGDASDAGGISKTGGASDAGGTNRGTGAGEKRSAQADASAEKVKINYWGYGPGWYFAPKQSYSASESAADEFRSMVKALHAEGIEVILEMSFSGDTEISCMQACLMWWTQVYHVDGFLLLAPQEIVDAVVRSPVFSDIKLISDYFDTAKMYPAGRHSRYRTLAEYNVGFRYDARKFLKGDSDSLQSFVSRCRYNPKDSGVINSITGHDGFTLMDLVSYSEKHNEANGENNRDGAANEYSWNCGTEGPSRRKEIMRLRLRQMKNAFAMVMLAQGTPMITAGDEMLNSQEGNSNPYCIDSELTWVKWSRSRDALDMIHFVRKLIAFRKEHPLLHQKAELTGSSLGGFFPDFSCHGSNAWFASFDQYERSVGMMYCSQEVDADAIARKQTSAKEGDYLYVAYNFHWEKRKLALPYLPSGRVWRTVIDTSNGFSERKDVPEEENRSAEEEVKTVELPGRTIRVLEG